MKWSVVCLHCKEATRDSTSGEINFVEGAIYFLCPHCKKQNKIVLGKIPLPLPRTRRA